MANLTGAAQSQILNQTSSVETPQTPYFYDRNVIPLATMTSILKVALASAAVIRCNLKFKWQAQAGTRDPFSGNFTEHSSAICVRSPARLLRPTLGEDLPSQLSSV